jgi:glutamate--cysteine ligase
VPISQLGSPAPIVRFDDLLAPFREAEKEPKLWGVGAELEKPGVLAGTLAPIPYEGERAVAGVLHALERHGWSPERETPDGPIIALVRGAASVTLEPGGQLELSGAPHADVHSVAAELDEHQRELDPICRRLGLQLLGLGFHPLATREELPWVPKKRYGIMRRFLPTRGARGLDMMLRTSTVQANLDYCSEADAMRKMRVLRPIAPLVTAMFANSPWVEGARGAGLSERGAVWLDVDPDRTGLLPALWKKGATYADYVEWALDVPMFLVKREAQYLPNTGQTFRQFWKDGMDGHSANQTDWRLHLNTLFPEVRLKRTIELRSADAQALDLAPALSALAVGLVYDERAVDELEALVESYTAAEISHLRSQVWRTALKTPFRGKPLAEVAQAVLTIARGGLVRRAIKDDRGRDESIHLTALEALAASAKSPAEVLLESIDERKDLRPQIIAATALRTPA